MRLGRKIQAAVIGFIADVMPPAHVGAFVFICPEPFHGLILRCVMHQGQQLQIATFAKLVQTITDRTYFMGDQCQSFVASFCLDPVKLI